jgi:hypothetical protein
VPHIEKAVKDGMTAEEFWMSQDLTRQEYYTLKPKKVFWRTFQAKYGVTPPPPIRKETKPQKAPKPLIRDKAQFMRDRVVELSSGITLLLEADTEIAEIHKYVSEMHGITTYLAEIRTDLTS